MNILITGGTGFAGRFISEYFVKLGHNVIATYRSENSKKCVQGVKYVKQELSEVINIDEHIDAIVHTACSHSGMELTMEEYVRDNIDSSRQIVDYARKNNIKTIVYFSTRSVYGEVREFEVSEETDIINADKYGLSKHVAEKIFQDASDLNTIGLRTPGIIGPGAHDIWLVNIVDKIKHGEDVCVSDFETRNLVCLKDISKFIYKLIEMSLEGQTYKYKVVNLSCKDKINNIIIANEIKSRLQSKSNITIKEPDSNLFLLDASRAFEMGFEPSLPLEIVNDYLDSLE